MTAAAPGRASVAWDPALYARFGDHRLRPALELFARIDLDAPRLVYDLGCGGGEIARLMADRWPGATVVGNDVSVEMLAKAAATPSRVRWEQADIRAWSPPEPPDLLYSNAMLQWVEGHNEIFPRLVGFLNPGGVLAVQVPLSWDEPSHQLMREALAEAAPDATALRATLDRRWVADPEHYYDLLRPLVRELDVWVTRYIQALRGDDPVLEWVKGTGLRPVLSGLAGDRRERFLEHYRARLRQAYPRRPRGETLYPFPRLFIVARK